MLGHCGRQLAYGVEVTTGGRGRGDDGEGDSESVRETDLEKRAECGLRLVQEEGCGRGNSGVDWNDQFSFDRLGCSERYRKRRLL